MDLLKDRPMVVSTARQSRQMVARHTVNRDAVIIDKFLFDY